jgi:hypothetical protein
LSCAARCGPVHPASPLSVCQRCSVSQCARRCCAPHRCRGVTPPVLRKCWSVRWSADMASARWRIVLDQPSPAARPGRCVRGSCGARPLRQSYIKPHCPQCQPVSRKLLLWQPPLRALSGEGNRLYAKLPSLGTVAQPSALPGRLHALYAPPSARPCGCRGVVALVRRCALRAVWLVSGLRPIIWCVPPPTLVLRRCAASALRAGLPVRPPWGLPQPARLCFWVLLQVC